MVLHSQKLVIAGCFSGDGENNAWCICSSGIPEIVPQYECNAEEADTRMWRHAVKCSSERILIYSPDTDVYNIGLNLIQETPKQYIIQLNVPHSAQLRYIHLNHLQSALTNDPDLASLPSNTLPSTMQILFICSGCDFISYFKSAGKVTFFNTFFQHAVFISGKDMIGCLNQTLPENKHLGFFAFIRLVGTVYFKKHLAAFSSVYGHDTSRQLFNSVLSLAPKEKHQTWLEKIRSVVAERITSEEERLPSFTSLWRHWQRSCWICQMWLNSPRTDLYYSLPPPEQSGWLLNHDGNYTIDWEEVEVQEKIKQTIG